MNIDFAFKALWKVAVFLYGGFEFDAVGDMKPTKRGKNARNQGSWLWPDNNHSRKYASASTSAKAAHTVRCFGRMYFAVYDPEQLKQM